MASPRPKPLPLTPDPTAPMRGSLPGTLGPAPTSTYTAPLDLTGKVFTGHAPGATPYGDFLAPTAANFEHSPDYQYLQDEQAKATQRSAAARGTLLNTGTSKQLQRDAAGIAAGDFGNAFNRALTGYTTNRDTNAQNFGQSNTQFRGDLDIFGANNRVGLDWAQFNKTPGAAPEVSQQMTSPVTAQSPADTYAQYVQAQRAAAAQQAPLLPLAPTKTTFRQREYRGAGQ